MKLFSVNQWPPPHWPTLHPPQNPFPSLPTTDRSTPWLEFEHQYKLLHNNDLRHEQASTPISTPREFASVTVIANESGSRQQDGDQYN